MLRNATQKGRLALIAGCASAALAGAGALRADLMVSHGFSMAFGAQKRALPFEVAAPGGRQQHAEVGDEGYWLTRAEVESPAPFPKPLAIGNRITMTDRDGDERHLEIVNLKVIGVPLIRIATGTSPVRLVLVTCRAVGATDHESRGLVRFIIEGEMAESTPPPPPAGKAL
jgi:hypothetical protein